MTDTHIHAPPHYFLGQIRARGCQIWTTVTKPKKTGAQALSQAVLAMGPNDKRARALLIDKSGWYEAVVVMEANR